MHKILERSQGITEIKIKDNKINKLFQSGCSKVLNPKNYNNINDLVLINTAGGITCNDKIKTSIYLENSNSSITTQAAEKIYSGFQDPANVDIDISINNSNLYWLPKELILFNNSKLNRKININLDKNSNLFFCETLIFGRKAMSEKITNIFFSDNWKIYVNSKLKHFEAINLNGAFKDNYINNFTFNNKSSLSTILVFGKIVENIENELKQIVNNIQNLYCEMTKFNDKIIIRTLANDNYDLKKALYYIFKNIIHDKITKSWNL